MVFRKYRPSKQWGKVDTRIFKAILKARNARKMPSFQIPDAVKAAGITVVDPNSPSFFTPITMQKNLPDLRESHPAFRVPSLEEHPHFHKTSCFLFDGSTALSDGIAQAAVLCKAIVKGSIPETVLHQVGQPDITEEQVCDAILHGEKYDPTLEKLPRRFDPVLFWIRHPVVYGTPVLKRLNIILSNLSRITLFHGLRNGKLTDHIRIDRDEPLSAHLPSFDPFSPRPFVIRFQPHITLQAPKSSAPWANANMVEEMNNLQIPSIEPLSPLIDLSKDHIYNDATVVARPKTSLSLHTLLWSREQDQKYPWTKEQNAANAILFTFGAAVAEATRRPQHRDLGKNPVLVKGIQLVNGNLDIVTLQLNTLNLSEEDPTKNIVWIEKACPLYTPKPFYEQLQEVTHVNMDTFRKFVAQLWS